jgi:lactoylglutathione lyase
MKQRLLLVLALAVAVGLFALSRGPSRAAREDKPASEFARTTIDLGVVVSDVDRAAKFYTEAIGFQEVKGFSVPADFCTKAGLTNNHALKIRVFVLGEGPTATKLKLMEVPDASSKKNDNKFVESELGFRYLTISVNDVNKALERLKKANVHLTSKGAVAIPEELGKGVYLVVVRDPDGNRVELVGPKK